MGFARFRRRDRVRTWLGGIYEASERDVRRGGNQASPSGHRHRLQTFKLFLMGSPGTTGLPVKIEIARILAPVVAGWAALSGLALLFHDRFQQLRIPLMRGHVVICGLGYVGSLFGDHLRKAGHQVVVVELDPANPLLEVCRSWRSPVVVGDARLESTLRGSRGAACGSTSRGVPDRCGEHRDRRRRAATFDRPSK